MITLLSSKVEEEIAAHFEENYELNKESFECIFEFDGAEITVPFEFKHEIVTYKNEWIGAEKDGVSYSIKDKEHFKIRRVEQNNYVPIESEESEYSKEEKLKRPNKKTLQQEIDSIIKHEERKADENEKSNEAIKSHNEWMNLNNR